MQYSVSVSKMAQTDGAWSVNSLLEQVVAEDVEALIDTGALITGMSNLEAPFRVNIPLFREEKQAKHGLDLVRLGIQGLVNVCQVAQFLASHKDFKKQAVGSPHV